MIDKKYRLFNAYEYEVRRVVKGLIEKEADMCQCEKCFLDICAIVLNSGFTRYVTTDRGELLAMIPNDNDNRDVDMLVAAMKGIKLVKEKPNH